MNLEEAREISKSIVELEYLEALEDGLMVRGIINIKITVSDREVVINANDSDLAERLGDIIKTEIKLRIKAHKDYIESIVGEVLLI